MLTRRRFLWQGGLLVFLADHLRWSAFWDKKHGLWRVAEDDPDSDLYAESREVLASAQH